MSGEPLLVVEGLETAYGGIAALRGVSFVVEAGSVVALVGANGAGKSTTLNTKINFSRRNSDALQR